MADFRRWIIALAVLALFAGLASAQTGGGGGSTLTCNANTSNTPTLRQEGITEQVGDIVITCTGGNITDGTAGSQVNITVAFSQSQITSRLENLANVSDALLLVDEPTTAGGLGPVAGFGSNAAFNACATPTTGGCTATGWHVLGTSAGNTTSTFIVQTTGPAPGAGGTQAPNVYQGVVNGNQVTFFGVPIVPPGTTGARVYRITNIRLNATAYSNGQSVTAFVTTSNPAALPISNGNPIVGFVTTSLKTTVGTAGGFAQCVTTPITLANTVTFSEANNFGSAFKTRTDPSVVAQTASPGPTKGQGAVLAQNVPGQIYNSESGFTPSTPGFVSLTGLVGTQIGLADFGTRFHAVFTNLPPGSKVFVSQSSLTVVAGVVTGVSPLTNYAQLVSGDTAAEGSFVAASTTLAGGIPVTEIDALPGSTTATATWEVVATNPNAVDTYTFGVYISYTAAPGTNSPALGASSVALNYAPTSASTSTLIPRFNIDPPASTAFTIAACQTVLLFPYLTNFTGFDTGLAIANTSTDPFGTTPQAGACKLNWYGTNAPAITTTPSVASGTEYTNIVSVVAPNFTGYMIAQCAFQYAHGFAFISDPGTRNFAMGYLALIVPDPSLQTPVGSRPPNNQNLAPTRSGEGLGN